MALTRNAAIALSVVGALGLASGIGAWRVSVRAEDAARAAAERRVREEEQRTIEGEKADAKARVDALIGELARARDAAEQGRLVKQIDEARARAAGQPYVPPVCKCDRFDTLCLCP